MASNNRADGRPRLIIVTDPLCSWCWGMTPEIEQLMEQMSDRARFDLLLGGVRAGTDAPISETGKSYLRRLWREVTATTGQHFAHRFPPDPVLYNSLPACRAVRVVTDVLGGPPFGYLHRLQAAFFLEARDLFDRAELAALASEFGVDRTTFDAGYDTPGLTERVRAEFETARSYGTHALPAVLLDVSGAPTLLAGGYATAAMLREQLDARLYARENA